MSYRVYGNLYFSNSLPSSHGHVNEIEHPLHTMHIHVTSTIEVNGLLSLQMFTMQSK